MYIDFCSVKSITDSNGNKFTVGDSVEYTRCYFKKARDGYEIAKEIYVGRFNIQYEARYGYLTPSKLSEKALASPANFYKMYINE